MLTYKVTTAEAEIYHQTKKFGIISEGCTGIWGQGDTRADAEAEAVAQIRIAFPDDAGQTDEQLLAGCWAYEIEDALEELSGNASKLVRGDK